ncbi:hypothetical protein [Nonomuraea sp. NPDC003804]|uniref:hypothetical protein n=1 Tax=Nonomuraea sp. NPDC003804 TaxID=3154547 RepID=UPI0033B622FD
MTRRLKIAAAVCIVASYSGAYIALAMGQWRALLAALGYVLLLLAVLLVVLRRRSR